MHRIGIIGHGPEEFSDREAVERRIDQVVSLLKYQYGPDELLINVCGEIGVGQWAARACINNKARYHLYLPFPPSVMAEYWYKEQVKDLNDHYLSAYATTIGSATYNKDIEKDMTFRLVDDSSFIVCFWTGKKQGITFEAIQWALQNNRLALNGLDDLKLITNSHIGKKHHERRKSRKK